MELNNQNYHSKEANQYYMSNSQFKDFITCEAMAMDKINGEFKELSSDACLMGSYVHAWAEGTLEEFKLDNPDMFTKKGELYAHYKQADRMIETLKHDKFVQYVLQGEKEVIITAHMFGAPWKIKLDVLDRVKSRLADLKTVKEIRGKHWNKIGGYYETFVEAFGYIRQLAIYAEVERIDSGRETWLEPLIVAVSKEDEPDKEIIALDAEIMQLELQIVADNMERILAVKGGLEPPERCEKCKYCRRTKKLHKVTYYRDLLE